VEYTEKKKRIRSIEAVPIYLAEELNSTGALKEYAEKTLGYTDPDVRIPCIKINSLLEVNGFFATLTGRTGDRLILPSATQLKMDKSSVDYIRLLENNAGEKDDSRLQYKKVSREANEILYGLFIEKHLYGIYSRKPNAIGQKLKDKESVFKNLTIGEQVEVLLQILQISCRVNTGADLKLLKESSSTGITLISKHISNQQSIFMINQSVTGLYQKKIDLLKI
jgi:CRISPR-associated endonuclease Csn1